MPYLKRSDDEPDSLAACRHEIGCILREPGPFGKDQQQRYNRLCDIEATFVRANKRIAAKLAAEG